MFTPIDRTPPVTDLRTTRRKSFMHEIARLVAETGLSQRRCFDVLNREFPTFDSKDPYRAFKQFKHRQRSQTLPPDCISEEIHALFETLPVIEAGPIPSERRQSTDERSERQRYVLQLKHWITSDPHALDTILHDYARLVGHPHADRAISHRSRKRFQTTE